MRHRKSISKGTACALVGAALTLPVAALALIPSSPSSAHTVAAISPASAAVRAPAAKNSYYVNTLNTGTAHSLGLTAGRNDAKAGTGRVTILDFGGQLSSGRGTELTNTVHTTNAQVERVAEQFAAGYSSGVKSKRVSLELGIGTNNSISVSHGLGQTWAHVAATANGWAHKHAPHTSIVGANDLEPSFGSPAAAEAWAKGYASVKGGHYLDYGSADGCPQTGASGGGCNRGWTQYTEWFVSTGVGVASATPEIYYNANAQQWALISEYGKNHRHRKLSISGVMDQYPGGGNNAATAWSELRTQLNRDGVSTSVSYSLAIRGE